MAIVGPMIPQRRVTLRQYVRYRHFFFMLLPVLIYFFIFHYGPMWGMLIAFKDYYPLRGFFGSRWVGFKHFRDLFSGMYFFPVLRNTLIISFLKLIFGFPAPIVLAVMLNEVRHIAFKRSIQTITYLPHFISWVVLAGLLIEILSPSRGPVNWFIRLLGLQPVFFIASESWFRPVLVVSSIWREIGWQSIIYLAAISNIDPELYDVAEIDGAGRFRKIISITIPSIFPVIVILFIFATGRIINDDFEQILNLLNPMVMSVGDVIMTYTFREGIQKLNYSYASAVGFFKNVVSLLLVGTTNEIARRMTGHSVW
jgi:putative aldouronate transport system permease protein